MPVTYATAHNGGKSEVNMNYIPNSNEYAFINVLRTTDDPWEMESNAGLLPPNQQNSDGYPTDLTGTGGGVKKRINVPSVLEKPGDWILSWTGSGCQLALGMAGGSVTTVSGDGFTSPWRFTPPADTSDYNFIDLHIYNIGTGISNIQLYHSTDATDFADGQMYTSKFKAKLKEANFGVIRFLNWQECNTTGCTTWATRKPLTALSWGQRDYRADYFAGTTSNTAAAYSVTVPGTLKHSSDGTTWTNGDAPKDKDTIIVKIGAGITSGSMTLQVGSGGSTSAITVVNPFHQALSTGGNDFPVAGVYATFIYDQSINTWIKHGGDVANNNTGIDNGVPVEAMLQLCAELGAHPWFHIPPYACDPMTDFVPQLATYLNSNMPSWMIPRFEVSNEFWNPQFYGKYYGDAKATAIGWTTPSFHQWYGKALSTVGQALNLVFGGSPASRSPKFQLCCAVQTGTGNTTASCSTSDERMSSQSYFSQAAAAQSGYIKDHAYNYITHVTCANYFSTVYDRTGDGNPAPLEATLASAVGGVRFTISSCSGGTMVVSAIDTSGGALTSGMTLEGLGVPSGTTILSSTGGATPTLTLSNSFTLPSGWHVYAYLTSGASSLQDYIDGCDLTVSFTASSSSDVLTVSATSGGASGVNSIQVGQYLTWPGSYSNSFIIADHSIDNTLTGTGGVGTYRLNAAPGSGAIPAGTTVTAFWLYSNKAMQIYITNWKTWAQGFGVQKMNFYEGGYSPDYAKNDSTSATMVMRYLGKFVGSTTRNASGVGTITRKNYDICTGLSDGTFTSEFPSQYLMTGPYPSLQVWNMLETIYKTNTPVFNAIAAYNQVAQYFINLRLRLHA